FFVIYGKTKSVLNAIGSVFSVFVNRYKTNLNISEVFSSFFSDFDNAFYSFSTSLLRFISLSHQFDYQMCPDSSDNFFTMSGTGGSTYFIIHKKCSSDDGRISNSSVHFISQTRCRTSSRKVSVSI